MVGVGGWGWGLQTNSPLKTIQAVFTTKPLKLLFSPMACGWVGELVTGGNNNLVHDVSQKL